jgi:hypothetical protein
MFGTNLPGILFHLYIPFLHSGLDTWLSSRHANVSTAHAVPNRNIYCFSLTWGRLPRKNSLCFVASQRHEIGLYWQLFVRKRDFLSFNGDKVFRNQIGSEKVMGFDANRFMEFWKHSQSKHGQDLRTRFRH